MLSSLQVIGYRPLAYTPRRSRQKRGILAEEGRDEYYARVHTGSLVGGKRGDCGDGLSQPVSAQEPGDGQSLSKARPLLSVLARVNPAILTSRQLLSCEREWYKMLSIEKRPVYASVWDS